MPQDTNWQQVEARQAAVGMDAAEAPLEAHAPPSAAGEAGPSSAGN